MKNIAVWKVVLLTLITGGLYAIFWAGRNRDYLVKHEKVAKKLPHWAWLLSIPVVFGLGFAAILSIILIGMGSVLSPEETGSWVFYISIVVTAITFFLGFWWAWYFSKTFAVVTQGRMNRVVALLLFFYIGAYVIAFQQYYINRLNQNKKGEVYKTSVGLSLLVCATGVLFVLSTIASVYSLAENTWRTEATVLTVQESLRGIEEEVQPTETREQQVDHLNREYMACVADLDKTYPGDEVQPGKEELYMEAFDACEAIYEEYESAYDAYMAE